MNQNVINKIFPDTINKESLKYDNEGLWSISLPDEADLITNIIKMNIGKLNNHMTIFDGTAGLGGNTISFAKYFKNVISCELNAERFELLLNNINIYKLSNVELINDDCIKYLNLNYDAYFFDPPWGGPEYKTNNKIQLKLSNLTLEQIINKIKNTNKTSPIFIKLPINYKMNEFYNFTYKIDKIRNYLLLTIY